MLPIIAPFTHWHAWQRWVLCGVVASLTVVLMLALQHGFETKHARMQQQYTQANQQWLAAQHQARTPANTPAPQLPVQNNAPLPPNWQQTLPNLVQDMTLQAEKMGLEWVDLQVSDSPTRDEKAWTSKVLNLQLKGDYGAMKRWLAKLLEQYPWLVLNKISIKASEQTDGRVTAQLSLHVHAQ
jgi:hypothetical protein